MPCLFCKSDGPFTVEHVIPESLGNDDLILRNDVCGSCNRHFSKIEELVLQKTPFAFWRVYLDIRTKKGRLPSVDCSQPKRQKGIFPAVHKDHDDVAYARHEDGSMSVAIDDPNIVRRMMSDPNPQLRLVFTPKILHSLGRFFCKMGVELICVNDPTLARSPEFEAARQFARFGQFDGLWPLFFYTSGKPSDSRQYRLDEQGVVEDVNLYAYRTMYYGPFFLFEFTMGTDTWIISLNEPFPVPLLEETTRSALNCIWYPPESMKRQP